MNARDELDALIATGFFHDSYYGDQLRSGWNRSSLTALVFDAGYRKPRIITTEEDLDALPVGSVIKDRDRDVCQRFRTGWRATIHENHGDPWLTDTMEIDLPATVLWEPTS